MKESEYTKAIAKFLRIRKNRILKPVFSTLNGPQKAADLMAYHLKQTLSGANNKEQVNTTSSTYYLLFQERSIHDKCPFNCEEMKMMIRELLRKKTPGVDQITSGMIQPLVDTISPLLFFLFQLCWQYHIHRKYGVLAK